jgi:hypothetical protein
MTDKITFPVELDLSANRETKTFDEEKAAILEMVKPRLFLTVEDLRLKSIDKVLSASDSTIILSFVDGGILVLKAEIVNSLPVLQVVPESSILTNTNIRERLLSERLETVFLAKKKSAEEIQKAELKKAAIAKLTPEELGALGLNNLA